VTLIAANAPDQFQEDKATAVLIRQVLGGSRNAKNPALSQSLQARGQGARLRLASVAVAA